VRKLVLLLFAAVAADALPPEQASAQCWYCDDCWYGDPSWGFSCVLMLPSPPIGYVECGQDGPCVCEVRNLGWCHLDPQNSSAKAEYEAELAETLAAIRANRSVPADGSFFYAKRGAEFVVRRKCDVAEVGRVAISEVEPAPVLGAG